MNLFRSHLKKVQTLVGLSEGETNEKSTSIGIAKEGLQVMKRVGKVVEKNVLNMKEQVDTLSKPPPFRQDFAPLDAPDLFRFGYIVIHDIRIFTKDIIIAPPGSEEKTKSGVSNEAKYQTTSAMGWSKPIALAEVKLYPAELCPPKDGTTATGTATVGQPIENVLNLALERILTEMATTGKLLNNAFADVFALFEIAGNSSSSAGGKIRDKPIQE